MLKRMIDFVDFNGEKRSKEYYFNLTETEIQEQNLRTPGGLASKLEKIIMERDPDVLVSYFKNLILDSYGVKSDDGISFIKRGPDGRRLAEQFEQTAAYNALFMELTTDTEAAIAFVNGIIPNVDGKKNANPDAGSDTSVAGAGNFRIPEMPRA